MVGGFARAAERLTDAIELERKWPLKRKANTLTQCEARQ